MLLGPLRISAGRSGRKIPRFNAFERFVHWLTAVSFIVLGLTGLNMTYGKKLLMPLIGQDAFSAFSEAAKYGHGFMSFPFVIGIARIGALWLKDNIPEAIDLEWFKQGGGFIRSKHPPAHRFNAGEKLVFWLALSAGAVVSASGYLLLFPFYATSITGMQIANVIHSVGAILFIALILGHIYIGTIGMEGALEAMWTGEVDFNWAKEHHNLWLEEELTKGESLDHAPHLSSSPAEVGKRFCSRRRRRDRRLKPQEHTEKTNSPPAAARAQHSSLPPCVWSGAAIVPARACCRRFEKQQTCCPWWDASRSGVGDLKK